jgi:lysophospholipase L1-like esterase
MPKILLVGSSIISRYNDCIIPGYTVINKGVPGLVTNEMFSSSYVKKVFVKNKYEYMILYCGNNDLKEGVDVNEVIKNIQRFITLFKTNFPSTKILVLSILTSPENHRLKIIDDIRSINRSLKKIDSATYVNMNHELSHHKYYLEDGVHLNSFGYEKINQIIREKI